jgi:Holliday junction DNA helicase RuvA
MIAALTGILETKNPTLIVVNASGIGLELMVPLSTSRALGEAGSTARLFVQSVFSRDGLALYGFATGEEKDVFKRLTSVRGIGPRAALNLLSRFTPAEIISILTEEKIETLKTVPGIGPKRAALILGQVRATAPAASATQEPTSEAATQALVSLGMTRAEAQRRVEQIPDRAALSLNELLTLALKG